MGAFTKQLLPNKMHKCIISLAANCNHKKNLSEARRCLGQILSHIVYTKELWTEPIHAKRPDMYLNQLAYAHTELNTEQLVAKLKEIELYMGRNETERSAGVVCIDLDLLQFDETRHHLRDWERDYVRQLLLK